MLRKLGACCVALTCCACAGREADPGTTFPLREIRSGNGVAVELQYKNDSNITGKALYPRDFRAYATTETARALQRAADSLSKRGYELVLMDAWRPPVAAALLWNAAVRADLRDMYAPPSVSGHTRGSSVDVTIRTSRGEPVAMPGDYDCHVSGGQHTTHSKILREAMKSVGFTGHTREWWHFDHPSGKDAKIVENPWERGGRRVVYNQGGGDRG